MYYKTGQPKWEYTMCKFQDFSAVHILRKIKFGHFEPPKATILTIYAALDFEFLGTFDIFKCEIFLKKSKFNTFKIVKSAVFDLLKLAKLDFTLNQSGRKIAKFQHCGISSIKISN